MTTTMGPIAAMIAEDAKTDRPNEPILEFFSSTFLVLLAPEPPRHELLNWKVVGYISASDHLSALTAVERESHDRYALVLRVQGNRVEVPKQYTFDDAPKWVAM